MRKRLCNVVGAGGLYSPPAPPDMSLFDITGVRNAFVICNARTRYNLLVICCYDDFLTSQYLRYTPKEDALKGFSVMNYIVASDWDAYSENEKVEAILHDIFESDRPSELEVIKVAVPLELGTARTLTYADCIAQEQKLFGRVL